MVFPDHTACTDPGNGSGGGPGPSATSFISHQLNLRFFLKKAIIFQGSREGPTFSGGGGGGGGGGSNFTRGGGGCQSIRIQITCDFSGGGGWVQTPFPPLDHRMKTHSSDVLLMV